ncbi:MAG TPA: polysaccharide biosynthesis protein [Marinobacter sp.]|nr:polysaccharide biosynthesis protein [Marinobacter sp.]
MGPIARSTIKTSFVLGLRLVVQAGTLLLVARMLGPEQFGAFAGIAALAVLLGALASLGSSLVLLGAMSNDPALRDQVLPWAIPTTLLTGAVLLTLFVAISKTLLAAADVSLMVLLAIGITEVWLQPLLSLVTTEHHAQGRIARSQLLHVIPLALRMLLAMSILLLSPTRPLDIYAPGYCLASLLPLMVLVLKTSWPGIEHWRLPSYNELKNTAGFAALNITNMGPAELDKTLAARLMPMAEAGVYSAGARAIGAVVLPVGAMLLSALPRLFREGSEHQQSKRLTNWIFSATVLYSVCIAGLLWMLAPVFNVIFGDEYTGIAETVQLLCLAVPGLALRLAAGNVLMAYGKAWVRVGFELVGISLLLTLAVALTSQFGQTGMPLALAGSELAMAAIGWGYVWYKI